MTTTTEPLRTRKECLPVHPTKRLVTLSEARAWDPARYLVQRKYDGELRPLTTHVMQGEITLLCEFMQQKSGGLYTAADRAGFTRFPDGWYAALTVSAIGGDNVLEFATRMRHAALLEYAPELPPNVILAEQLNPETLTLETGAEGFAAHDWTAPWGNMLCHKRGETYLCRVTRTGATQSVQIERILAADASSVTSARTWLVNRKSDIVNSPGGAVKLGGGKCDQVKLGSLIRVEGMGLTAEGKIRQPQPAREWLVQY